MNFPYTLKKWLDFVSVEKLFLIQVQSENSEIGYQEFEYTGVWCLDALAIQWK